MFVTTKDCEILNLTQCIKIVVMRNEIRAYAPVVDSPISTNLVASFDTAVEAGYALHDLYKSLRSGKTTWDPYTIKPLYTLWDKIDNSFDNKDVPYGLKGGAKISAFSLDKVTIAYDPEVKRHLGKKTIAECQKKVARKLQELLGDASIKIEWVL